MNRHVENLIENTLLGSRWIIFPAVLASIVASGVLILIGIGQIALVVHDALTLLNNVYELESYQIAAVSKFIAAVDVFLIATVLLIFGLGLYELFISRIDRAETDESLLRVLAVRSLDELKERLAKVIVMALVVTFFKVAISLKCEDSVDLLFFAIGIFLAAAALFLTTKAKVPAG
jgi:uncharacterized protein (TIGR00645 family)